MSSNDKSAPPSTLGAYVDSAIGGAQELLGSLTGNTADQSKGQTKQAGAQAEHDASEASAKAGPFTLSSTGAIAKDDPNRSAGSWNQTVGAAKEAIGNLVGAEGLKQEGIQQNKEGKAQEAQGQLNDLGSGIADRVSGAVGGAAASLTGNTAQQEARQAQHDQGKSLQRGVELDLDKQVNAQGT